MKPPPAPLLLPTLGLAGGIALDAYAGRGPVPYLTGVVLALLLLLWPVARREVIGLITLLAGFSAGGLMHQRQVRRVAPDHIVRYTADAPTPARLRGMLIGEAAVSGPPAHPFARWWPPSERTRFVLEVDSVESLTGWQAATGRLRVTVRAAMLDISAGMRLEVFGSLFRPRGPENPGQTDWAAIDRRKGIMAGIRCEQRECVRILSRDADLTGKWWAELRRRGRGLLLADLLETGEVEGTLLDTMVLGRRTAIDPKVNESFLRTGLTHYLAVSGMNLGILAMLLWGFGRAVGLSQRTASVGVMLGVCLYAWSTDPLPPILRAAVMTLAVCLSLCMGRPRNFLNSLCLAALAILCWTPGALLDAGFQLSFASLLGIVYGSPPLIAGVKAVERVFARLVGRDLPAADEADLFVTDRQSGRLGRWVAGLWRATRYSLAISLAAWLATLPIILVQFGRLALWGWLNTLLVAPLVSLLMAAGPAKLLIGLAWPSAAQALTSPVQALSALLIYGVEWLAELPLATVTLPPLPTWVAASCYLAVCLGFQRRRIPHGVLLTCLAGGLALAGSIRWLLPRPGDGRLKMTVLSVGRGTATVLEFPDGQTVLYDAGASGAYDPGKSTIVPFLRHRGIRRVDAVIVSHPNLDHFSGLPSVLEAYGSAPVFWSPYFGQASPGDRPEHDLLELLRNRGKEPRLLSSTASPLIFGDARMEVLWPPPGLEGQWTANDSSLVLRVAFAGVSILLTGDIESPAQRRLLDSLDLRADVLMLPHHGATCATTEEFVAATGASVLLSSTNARTVDRGPRYAKLIRGRQHVSTADDGAITVTLDPEGVRVEVWKVKAQSEID